MLDDIIKKWGGLEVSPMEVYTDIFHLGEGAIQKHGEKKGEFKTNPLGYKKNDKDSKGNYRIFFEDTFEKTLEELQESDFAIMNGITYFGRKNLMQNASKMYAIIFDLDDVTDITLDNFFSGAFRAEVYPVPNYIVMSGHGVHLYYLFENAVPLYPNIKIQLKELKYALTTKMWNMYTSTNDKKQYQGINQGFRVIGGKTKILGVRTRAFRVNTHPYSLKELCRFVPIENRVDETKLWKESKMTLEQAKKKYPEWYEKRVLNQQPKGTWICNRALYDWWIRKVLDGAEVGHRYFCIMCLAIYGVKSGISYEEVKKDALSLVPSLNNINPNKPFTEDDCNSALECYDEKYITFPIKDIEKIAGIPIPKNKRNGRKQAVHLKIARSTLAIMNEDVGKVLQGRPQGSGVKKEIVQEWRKEHPDGKKIDCERDTGLSRHTVLKWWDT